MRPVSSRHIGIALLAMVVLAVWSSTISGLGGAVFAAGSRAPVARGEPSHGDVDRQRGTETGPGEGRLTPAPRTDPRVLAFQQAVREPSSTRNQVGEALYRLHSLGRAGTAFTAAVAALADAAAAPVAYDPISPDTPHLLAKRPADDRLVPISDYLRTGRVAELLGKPVDRSKLVLMPFVYSTAGKARLRDTVPLVNRVRGDGAERLLAGRFDDPEQTLFDGMRGQTVVVVGHIVGNGREQAFEVMGPNGKRYIPISRINDAARTVGFNWVPLGCETNVSAPVGTVTKINDIEALDAFVRALRANGSSTMGGVLADLSGPTIKIAIDLARLDKTDVIPIELIDQEGSTYKGGPKPQAQPPEAGTQPPSQDLISLVEPTPDPASPVPIHATLCGPASEDVVGRSLQAEWLVREGPWIWFQAFTAASLAAMCLALGELPFLRAMSVGERWVDAFTVVVFGSACWGMVAALGLISYDGMPGNHGLLLTIPAALAPIYVIAGAGKTMPDLRLARLGMGLVAPVACLPFIIWCGLAISIGNCWIVPMPQIWRPLS